MIYIYIFIICFLWEGHTRCAQGFLLVLCSCISPGMLWTHEEFQGLKSCILCAKQVGGLYISPPPSFLLWKTLWKLSKEIKNRATIRFNKSTQQFPKNTETLAHNIFAHLFVLSTYYNSRDLEII